MKDLTPLQKLPKNGRDWGKLIVAVGFKKLPKVQKIAQSGHTGHWYTWKLLLGVEGEHDARLTTTRPQIIN